MGIHLFPFEVKEAVRSQQLWAGPIRCGVPTVAALSGITVSDGRAFVTVAFEWAQTWKQLPSAKVEREALQLKRLLADFRSARHPEPFQDWQPGPDPQDFVVASGEAERGLECTQLVGAERLKQEAMFEGVRTAVLRTDLSSLQHLAGKIVYASFDQAAGSTRDRAKALIEVLETIDPPTEHEFPLPAKLDPKHVCKFAGGQAVAVPLAAPTDTPFYAFANFELALSFDTTYFQDEVWAQLVSRIQAKNVPGTNDLLISAGAPTSGSQSYMSEDFLARLIVARAESEAIPASNLERIFLHVWPRRAIYEITTNAPGAALLCGEAADPLP